MLGYEDMYMGWGGGVCVYVEVCACVCGSVYVEVYACVCVCVRKYVCRLKWKYVNCFADN